MKLILSLIFTAYLSGQTTTISATALKDQSGNLVNGSLCLGTTLYNPITCQNITAGVLPSYSVANGSYVFWLNSTSSQTIFSTSSAVVLNGTAIAADTYLQNQFAASVAGTVVYLTAANVTLTCNGNTVLLPVVPNAYQQIQVVNSSTTAACSVSGNGNSIIYQSASVSPANLPAKNTAVAVWVLNYDLAGAGHNAWIVTHLGS